ncbi:MAG: cytochrome b/b6 domain-containing protein [Thermoanaerobacteraceae bacterium]|uniref:formate dehydrogenase subunit gamma n=1 Tax=Thermanaeromonas sp. C210 TaxID=2731925 RepID=UPI00155D3264|nr:cytochrome b/b6 domain-containing protein [Thermanaeromonas sp. C210]MBE3582397.1 cytochrome b/b6 domain-containing protein [Thermoanaerobacteraceae bacterium]GFN21820.1 membrane protein [Thermanaeromonas sp. C210]
MANGRVKRHSGLVRFVHCSVVLSTFLLIFSGLGQLPLYKRYMVDRLPGLSWSSDFGITLIIHYAAAAWLVFAVALHVAYHAARKEFDLIPRRGDFKESWLVIKAMFGRGEEPPADKYLAEQRLAYAYMAVSFFIIIVTGFIKVLKNLPSVALPYGVVTWATHLHNVATVLLILGIGVHLAAFLLKPNRPLIFSMLTGYVSEEYARCRHPLWYRRIKGEEGKPGL